MYLGDGLAGSCKIQRWLESYSCEAGTSRRRRSAATEVASTCSQLYGQVVSDHPDGPFHALSCLGVYRVRSCLLVPRAVA